MKLKITKNAKQRLTAILDLSRHRNRIPHWKAATVLVVILGLGLLAGGCGRKHKAWSLKDSKIAGQLRGFISEKKAQADAAASVGGKEAPPEFNALFAAAGKGDWLAVSNTFRSLSHRAPQYEHGGNDRRLTGTAWEAVKETYGVYEILGVGGEKYFAPLGREIIASIPAGSIYFGGTDIGRFLITAMVQSQVEGDPFFVLTQNALADKDYLAYLRTMYGEKIYTPTDEDSKSCFDEYLADAQERRKVNKLRPGENVKEVNGKLEVTGQVSVMSINALLAKVIFDKNPAREFYLEESFPLDWMFPYLEPHGLILKLNRQPLAALPEEVMQTDHDYWAKYLTPLIGDWLKDDTSVRDVCAFSEKVYLKHNFGGFNGDREFAQNGLAQRSLSKLRSSIVRIYMWRLGTAEPVPAQYAPNGDAERERLVKEADFAFRQSVALCPYSPEVVYLYVSFLLSQHRAPDALLVAETASHLEPKNRQWHDLVAKLKK
jgi:hypothetical protein